MLGTQQYCVLTIGVADVIICLLYVMMLLVSPHLNAAVVDNPKDFLVLFLGTSSVLQFISRTVVWFIHSGATDEFSVLISRWLWALVTCFVGGWVCSLGAVLLGAPFSLWREAVLLGFCISANLVFPALLVWGGDTVLSSIDGQENKEHRQEEVVAVAAAAAAGGGAASSSSSSSSSSSASRRARGAGGREERDSSCELGDGTDFGSVRFSFTPGLMMLFGCWAGSLLTVMDWQVEWKMFPTANALTGLGGYCLGALALFVWSVAGLVRGQGQRQRGLAESRQREE
uniref:Transmembrane protein n=1 Tax=Chromera velia CCMP2878 TaxID=1169474 RepID=A0A0G4H7V4_9ALVE|eukprot:Cvel_25071.t1-p1 / transcript=Cvel_25071.t1 / gene=Cvel_25071 / organism=Chromera_velia_CCMP2878 / gene_product=hypothetical protein / transcript_product=hypothetical protein / location=Cvel_scaffold2790:5968-9270(-) / protein_length=285 / sequence_SO=supercontig / SO=protein_coding / is_pseudo=false